MCFVANLVKVWMIMEFRIIVTNIFGRTTPKKLAHEVGKPKVPINPTLESYNSNVLLKSHTLQASFALAFQPQVNTVILASPPVPLQLGRWNALTPINSNLGEQQLKAR